MDEVLLLCISAGSEPQRDSVGRATLSFNRRSIENPGESRVLFSIWPGTWSNQVAPCLIRSFLSRRPQPRHPLCSRLRSLFRRGRSDPRDVWQVLRWSFTGHRLLSYHATRNRQLNTAWVKLLAWVHSARANNRPGSSTTEAP